MFYINSPLSQFEITNLIGIFTFYLQDLVYFLNYLNLSISFFFFKQQKIKKIKMINKLNRQMNRSLNVIQQLSNQKINQFKLNTNIKITQSFSLLGFVMSQLNLNVDETSSNFTQVFYGFLSLSLVALFCLINIVGFLITYILIQNGNYEKKYPKLKNFINYYKKISLLYVSIEVLLCFLCLLALVYFSYLYVQSGIKA